MGTWNTKPFGNDTASDWLWELEESKNESVIKAAFGAEADGEETIAAAAVVEAARRQPVGKLPPEAKQWVFERGFVPSDALVKQAIKAVEKIKTDSELRECWTESKSLTKWLEQVDLLLAGLRKVQSAPPPVRKPKAPAPPHLLYKLIEKVNPNEESPLREKLREKLETIKDLDAHVDGTFFETPLNLVVKQGLLPEAKWLVERGAKINPVLKDPLNCSTPLEDACANGLVEMATWLLTNGAQIYFNRTFAVFVNPLKRELKTFAIPRALYNAIHSGSIATIEVLVQHGARLVTDDLEKEFSRYRIGHESLLHKAAESNHPHVIEFLVKNGLSLEARDSLGFTPLLKAVNLAAHNDRKNVVEKLLSLGANPNAKDNDSCTALDMASYHDSNEAVCQLLKSHGGKLGKEIPN